MGLFSADKRRNADVSAPRVGLYGKHPSAGDFLRHHASGALGLAFDQWLSTALVSSQRLLGPGWTSAFTNLFPSPFLFAPVELSRCLLGVLVTSADTTERQFPLALFAELERSWVNETSYALPLEPFVAQAIKLLQQRDTMRHEELIDETQRLVPPSLESLQQARKLLDDFAAETTVASIATELFDSSAQLVGPGQRESEALEAWRRALPVVRESRRARRGRYGLRCPVSARPSLHAAVWLALGANREGAYVPNAIWNRHSLLLYPGAMGKSAFAGVLDAELRDDGLCDLRQLPGAANEPEVDGSALLAELLSGVQATCG